MEEKGWDREEEYFGELYIAKNGIFSFQIVEVILPKVLKFSNL